MVNQLNQKQQLDQQIYDFVNKVGFCDFNDFAYYIKNIFLENESLQNLIDELREKIESVGAQIWQVEESKLLEEKKRVNEPAS